MTLIPSGGSTPSPATPPTVQAPPPPSPPPLPLPPPPPKKDAQAARPRSDGAYNEMEADDPLSRLGAGFKRLLDTGKDMVNIGVDAGMEMVEAGLTLGQELVDSGKNMVDAGMEMVDAGLDIGQDLIDSGIQRVMDGKPVANGAQRQDQSLLGTTSFREIERAQAEQRKNARIPVALDQFEVYDDLSRRGQQRFRELSPEQRAQYVKLSESLDGNRRARRDLEGLLESRNLQKPEMLNSLSRIATGPLNKTLDAQDPAELLASHLEHMNHIGAVYQGKSNFCGPAAALETLMNQDLAGYAERVADLLTTGKLELPNGDTVALDMRDFAAARKESAKNGDGRDSLSSLLLSSFQNYAQSQVPEDGAALNEPLSASQVSELFEAVLPQNAMVGINDANRDAAMNAIASLAGKNGKGDVAIPVGVLNGNPPDVTGHMITITNVQLNDEGRIVGMQYASNGEVKSIPRDRLEEFKQRLALVNLPAELVEPKRRPTSAPLGNADAGEGGFGEADAGEGGFGDVDSSEGGFGQTDGAEGGFGDANAGEGGFGQADGAEGGFGDANAGEGGFGRADGAEGGFGDADASGGGFGFADGSEAGFGTAVPSASGANLGKSAGIGPLGATSGAQAAPAEERSLFSRFKASSFQIFGNVVEAVKVKFFRPTLDQLGFL